mmetsp:Transcript_19987/g.22312  ORF Transcript_19987/g.22312 Transcript_19987/m.22312 type:complete len:81 (+) Transcript_19987:292-534(+)
MGRKALLAIYMLIAFLCLGVPIIYVVIFADSATPVLQNFILKDNPHARDYVVIGNAVILLWFCLNKEIHKLRIASYTSII